MILVGNTRIILYDGHTFTVPSNLMVQWNNLADDDIVGHYFNQHYKTGAIHPSPIIKKSFFAEVIFKKLASEG